MTDLLTGDDKWFAVALANAFKCQQAVRFLPDRNP
jgi:hypothetical protein